MTRYREQHRVDGIRHVTINGHRISVLEDHIGIVEIADTDEVLQHDHPEISRHRGTSHPGTAHPGSG